MSYSNKTKINLHIQPELIARVDAEYELYDYSSRSAFICAAVEFFLGYLHNQDDTDYMTKTTLTFLENQWRSWMQKSAARCFGCAWSCVWWVIQLPACLLMWMPKR